MTRYHYMKLAGQCNSCNGFNGGMTYEYGPSIDRKYGNGWAALLEKLARTQSDWAMEELEQLRSAARMGARAHGQLYFELRPNHFMSGK